MIKTFEQFSEERELTKKLIRILHEGIRVVKIDSSLNEKSNTASFAQREIENVIKEAKKKGDKAIIEEFAPEMLALIDKFGNSGQSGGSAPYTAGAIVGALKKLLMQEPISPVMNEDDEWNDVSDMGDGSGPTHQNKRCSALFKEGKGDPYYLDAIVFKDEKGLTFTGSAMNGKERIKSRQYVKKFPFEPKTFTVDVVGKEVKPDDWEYKVKDPNQLKEVFKYYKPFKDNEKAT